MSEFIDHDSVSKAISEGKLDVGCKDDLRTVPQKVQFVSKFGKAAFAALPLHRTPTVNSDPATMTARDWRDLPRSEKVRIPGLIGDLEVGRILNRK